MRVQHRGARAPSTVHLLGIPLRVVRGCHRRHGDSEVFGLCYQKCLVGLAERLKQACNFSVAFRGTERGFKARVALSLNIPVRAIDHVVKRGDVSAARVCTGIASHGISRSVGHLGRRAGNQGVGLCRRSRPRATSVVAMGN